MFKRSLRRHPLLPLTTGLLTLFIASCAGLPSDFESLTLEEKVAVYEEHWKWGGVGLERARSHIAWHGWKAADLMAEYVKEERMGLPIYEAIEIIYLVQWRGCSLQGSAAESALKDFLVTAPADSVERLAAENALKAIQENDHFPGVQQVLPGGPCQERAEAEGEERENTVSH